MSRIGHMRKRKGKDGQTRYQMIVEVWRDGKKFYKSKTFSSEKAAKSWGSKTRYEIDSGQATRESLKSRKLSEAIQKFIDDELTADKPNRANVKQHLGWWNEQIGRSPLTEVTPSVLSDCRDKLLKKTTPSGKTLEPATVLKYLSSLSSVFEMAIKVWFWVEKNPVKMIKKPSISNARSRFLSEDECQRLLASCKESRNPYLHSIVALALSTGMRRGELLWLRWQDVAFEKRYIILEKTKNGTMRYVPMVGMSQRILQSLRDSESILDKSHHVFPSLNLNRYIDIRSAWNAALKRADIKNFTFHDLRHSCASFLTMSGASQRDIAEILGHKDLRMTHRYTHLSQSHLSEALERATEKFMGEEIQVDDPL